MCLAIPGELKSINGTIGLVDFGGVRKEVDLSFLPEAEVGDFVLVHVGFAIQKVNRKRALEARKLFSEMKE